METTVFKAKKGTYGQYQRFMRRRIILSEQNWYRNCLKGEWTRLYLLMMAALKWQYHCFQLTWVASLLQNHQSNLR